MAKSKFLIGLIGEGIQASLSPALHEEEARCQGLTLHYQLIDLAQDGSSVDDLPRLIASAEAAGFDGLNITHPCKQAVLPLLSELSGDARAIGAVNTVVFREGKRKGFNTDCSTGTTSAPKCWRAESQETTPAGGSRPPTSSHPQRTAWTA